MKSKRKRTAACRDDWAKADRNRAAVRREGWERAGRKRTTPRTEAGQERTHPRARRGTAHRSPVPARVSVHTPFLLPVMFSAGVAGRQKAARPEGTPSADSRCVSYRYLLSPLPGGSAVQLPPTRFPPKWRTAVFCKPAGDAQAHPRQPTPSDHPPAGEVHHIRSARARNAHQHIAIVRTRRIGGGAVSRAGDLTCVRARRVCARHIAAEQEVGLTIQIQLIDVNIHAVRLVFPCPSNLPLRRASRYNSCSGFR